MYRYSNKNLILKTMKKNQKKIVQLFIGLLFWLPAVSWGQIKVYTMDGCGRCRWTVNYLKENNIPFTELNTTKDKKNNIEMWDLLAKNGGANGSVTMPVIDNNGVVAYSIPNLEDYVAKLGTKGNTSQTEEKKPRRKRKR
jgi:glutaredoxin